MTVTGTTATAARDTGVSNGPLAVTRARHWNPLEATDGDWRGRDDEGVVPDQQYRRIIYSAGGRGGV